MQRVLTTSNSVLFFFTQCFGVLNSFHGHVFNLLPRFTDPPRQKQSQSSKSRDRPMYIDRNMEVGAAKKFLDFS